MPWRKTIQDRLQQKKENQQTFLYSKEFTTVFTFLTMVLQHVKIETM